ncbi:MAG: ATP-binding protein [Candidatus Binatia bacterium]|nr:ATP-binding protein [Candidatus Binatia bacterium]
MEIKQAPQTASRKIGDIQVRLEEAEEILEAIRKDEVDAFVVSGEKDDRISTLEGTDRTYRIFFQEMNEGAATLMLDGPILSTNRRLAEILRTTVGEIIGSSILRFVEPNDQERMKALLSQGRARAEISFRATDGTAVPVYVSLATAEVSNTGCICLLVNDVTQRKKLEQTMREYDRLAAMGATAAVFAHEVGNPLNGISTMVQMLQRHFNKQNDSYANSTLIELQHEIQRLSSLLHDFRSLSRPQKLNLARIDLARVAAEVLTTHALEFSELHVEVKKEFPADLPEVTADEERVKQVLLNLCKNAVEAMPNGGTLTLHGYLSGEDICLEIADTGVGIPKGVDIFELFTTTKPMGTGVGLALVRQIISVLGGTITYVSEPNKGTTFFLLFPRNSQPPDSVSNSSFLLAPAEFFPADPRTVVA